MLTSRLFGGPAVTSLPCSHTVPVVGSSKPAIIRIVVVLPQPDGPSKEKNSPSTIRRSIVRTAATTSLPEWNSLATPASSMAGSVMSSAVPTARRARPPGRRPAQPEHASRSCSADPSKL